MWAMAMSGVLGFAVWTGAACTQQLSLWRRAPVRMGSSLTPPALTEGFRLCYLKSLSTRGLMIRPRRSLFVVCSHQHTNSWRPPPTVSTSGIAFLEPLCDRHS